MKICREVRDLLEKRQKQLTVLTDARIRFSAVKQSFLTLREDWDDEGAAGYKKETLDRAWRFWREISARAFKSVETYFPPPVFRPGPRGSVDIRWITEEYELLLNIPEDSRQKITFYGEHRQKSSLRGSVSDGEDSELLIVWLNSPW